MSATIFPPLPKPRDSRIPVPQSPTLLRRTGSLRLPLTTSIQLRHSQVPNPQPDAPLKRGNSFHSMERGERRSKHGAPPGNYRPNSLETPNHRSPKNSNGTKGAITPQSPSRIRSLVRTFIYISYLLIWGRIIFNLFKFFFFCSHYLSHLVVLAVLHNVLL